jgi:translation initiation factor 2D
MVLHHSIGYKDQQPRFVKGGAKPIHITQELRTGRKTVTKVSGLEHFLVDVDAFGQELQVRCAGSVSSKSWCSITRVKGGV